MTVTLEEFTADFTPDERAKVAARTAELVDAPLPCRQGGEMTREGFVRVTAGRQRVAQHAHPQATFKPRGRATRPMWQSVSACRLGGSSGRAVRVPTAGVPHFRAR